MNGMNRSQIRKREDNLKFIGVIEYFRRNPYWKIVDTLGVTTATGTVCGQEIGLSFRNDPAKQHDLLSALNESMAQAGAIVSQKTQENPHV